MSKQFSACAARRRYFLSAITLASMVLVVGTGAPSGVRLAHAQAQIAVEEIVVTARKREERLQDIPLAISAFSAQDIEDAGFQELGDLTMQTPGIDFNARGSGSRQVGRVDSAIRLRGVFQSTADHRQTTSLFIDGIYVLGTANVIGLQDLERVEVIKGPQSAFFGRNTFAGAINYITKTPSLDEYQTKVDFSMATYDKYNGSILTSGPLIEGKLAYQVNARLYSKGGEWPTTDGGKLGREQSNTVSGLLYGEPNENWSFKLRAYYQTDDDGPPVSGLIRGRFADTCSGTTIQRFDENDQLASFSPTELICGDVPGFGYQEQPDSNSIYASPHYPFYGPGYLNRPRTLLSRETSMQPPLFFQDRPGFNAATGASFSGPQPDAITRFLGGSNGSDYLGKKVPDMYTWGMKRRQIRFALNSDYEFTNGALDGYTATFLGGYNHMRMSNLYDYDSVDDSVWHSVNPKHGVDFSVEARLTSPQDRRFRWLAGATYYDQDYLAAGGLYLTSSFRSRFVGPAILSLPPTSGNEAIVWGVFASASYDITEELTFDLEMRYLQDKRTVEEGSFFFTDKFKQYTPRAILTYRPAENTTIYGQYSQGVLPGVTNGIIATCSEDAFIEAYPDPKAGPNFGNPIFDSECQQIRDIAGDDNFRGATASQKLKAFEVGLKQTFLEGRIRSNITAWHYEWTNRPYGLTIVWVRDAELPSERDGRPNDFPNNQGISVPGSQKLWGLEWEAGFVASENLDVQFNLSLSDNNFTEFRNVQFIRTTGVRNFKDNKIGRYPSVMGNLSATYSAPLAGDWDWYSRADFMYHGEYWAGEINLARAPDWLVTNVRAGLTRGDIRIELFVRNLLQTRAWSTVTAGSDITSLAFDFNSIRGYFVTPQEKRTIGIRTNLTF